jgi:hypothetical protein
MALGVVGNQPCARPATDEDKTTKDQFGRFRILTHRYGFNDIGLLRKQVNVGEKAQVCSAVLVSTEWAITALHCVATGDNGGELLPVNYGDGRGFSVVFWGCRNIDEPYSCDLLIPKIEAIHPIDASWRQQGVWPPDNDIALLKLRFIDTSLLTISKPSFSNFRIESRVTTVGWGVSDQEYTEYEVGDRALVGWHNFAEQANGFYRWRWDRDQSSSVPCHGDSGGPAFLKEMYGRREETPRELFAIQSRIERNQVENRAAQGIPEQYAASCRIGEIVYTVLAPHKQTICRIASDIAGCTP